MSKKEDSMNGAMIVPESVIERFISAMEQQNANDNARFKERELREENQYLDEKDLVRKQFQRIIDAMDSTDILSDEYVVLTKRLKEIREVFGYSW